MFVNNNRIKLNIYFVLNKLKFLNKNIKINEKEKIALARILCYRKH
jgi:hypothetical protein